jgi:Pentapeptide repeats (8 copies)
MVWKISPEELLVRYDNGERDFAGIDLISCSETPWYYHGIELKGIVLRDINLRGAVLKEVDLTGVDLRGADLGGVFMEQCILSGATIRDANLCAANVSWCSFDNADLRGSYLDHINAYSAWFNEAQMPHFECAVVAGTNFKGTNLTKEMICAPEHRNLVWNTIMPDGTQIDILPTGIAITRGGKDGTTTGAAPR